MDPEEGEQLFSIEASVNRLTSTCFKVCDEGKGSSFNSLQCLEQCISEWMGAKTYVQGRWGDDIRKASLYNKNLQVTSKHV